MSGCREHHGDLAAEQLGHGRGAALVGHVHDIDLCHRPGELTGQVLRSAAASRAEAHLPGLRPRHRDQLRNAVGRCRGIDHQHVLLDQRHRDGNLVVRLGSVELPFAVGPKASRCQTVPNVACQDTRSRYDSIRAGHPEGNREEGDRPRRPAGTPDDAQLRGAAVARRVSGAANSVPGPPPTRLR